MNSFARVAALLVLGATSSLAAAGDYGSRYDRGGYDPVYSYQEANRLALEQGYADDRRYRSGNGYRYDGRRHHGDGAPLVGALIGGAIGNQFGHGDGRVAATVAGALIGAAIASDGRDYDRDDRYSYYGRRDWHDHRYNQGYRYGYGGYGSDRRYDYRDGRYCHGR